MPASRFSPRRIAIHALALFCLCATPVLPPQPAFAAQAQKEKAKKTTKVIKIGKKKVTAKSAKKRALSPARVPSVQADWRLRYAALVVDADKGRILYEQQAGEQRHPASLTKMMTLYLLFDALKRGKMEEDTLMPVSAHAASQAPTNISLTAGDRITAKTAIESLVVRSANDSAMVVAEALGGSQEGFARLMNEKSRQLGMTETKFYNPNGLPDNRQVTTAYDMAKLAIALRRDFPQYYRYFALRSFQFRGKIYEGHNRLLGRYPGADGVKTGYIGASGFNLVTSVRRGGYSLVGVVLGGRTASSRDQEMMEMLDNTMAGLARRGQQVSGRMESFEQNLN